MKILTLPARIRARWTQFTQASDELHEWVREPLPAPAELVEQQAELIAEQAALIGQQRDLIEHLSAVLSDHEQAV
jgi:hypothetical protein